MNNDTRERLVDGSIWLRGLHMLILIVAYNIAEAILILLAVFQFLCALITGSVNEPLQRFGKNLSIYVGDIFEFLTFNSDVRPFPWEPWPDEEAGGESWREDATDYEPLEEVAPAAPAAPEPAESAEPSDKDESDEPAPDQEEDKGKS